MRRSPLPFLILPTCCSPSPPSRCICRRRRTRRNSAPPSTRRSSSACVLVWIRSSAQRPPFPTSCSPHRYACFDDRSDVTWRRVYARHITHPCLCVYFLCAAESLILQPFALPFSPITSTPPPPIAHPPSLSPLHAAADGGPACVRGAARRRGQGHHVAGRGRAGRSPAIPAGRVRAGDQRPARRQAGRCRRVRPPEGPGRAGATRPRRG